MVQEQKILSKQDDPINSNECQNNLDDSILISDYDISNKTEFIFGNLMILLFFMNASLMIYQIIQTIKFIKSEKVKVFKLRLTIQFVALLSVICYIASLLILLVYQGRIITKQMSYSSEAEYSQSLLSMLKQYLILQTGSSSSYTLAFFLSFFVWYEVLSVNLEKKWIKIMGYTFHVMSFLCFSFQIVGLLLLIIQGDSQYSHAAVSASVLFIGVYVLITVYLINRQIEYVYEVNEGFKNQLKRYIYWLAVSCLCRPIFNLIMVFQGFQNIQCFKYVQYEDNIFILENQSFWWIAIYFFFVFFNNISLIPLILLLSPRRKFRQVNSQQLLAKSFEEDLVQSQQREENVSNLEVERKGTNNYNS